MPPLASVRLDKGRTMLLAEAQEALREARRYQDMSIAATQSDVIRSMEAAQKLRMSVARFRRRNTEATVAAVERDMRTLREVGRQGLR